MKQYFKNQNTYICFDDDNKSISTVTSSVGIDNKSMVYTQDDGIFDQLLASAIQKSSGDGSLGPNTTGWAQITEEIYNQAKAEVKAFFVNF